MSVHTRSTAVHRGRNGGDPAATAPSRSVWDSPQLWTAEQVAKVLQVPKSWVYEQSRVWIATGGERGMPTVTLGRYRRYRPQAIKRYVEALEAAPDQEGTPA